MKPNWTEAQYLHYDPQNETCHWERIHLTVDINQYEFLYGINPNSNSDIYVREISSSPLIQTFHQAQNYAYQHNMPNSPLIDWHDKGHIDNNGKIIANIAVAQVPSVTKIYEHGLTYYISLQYKEELLTTIFQEQVLGIRPHQTQMELITEQPLIPLTLPDDPNTLLGMSETRVFLDQLAQLASTISTLQTQRT